MKWMKKIILCFRRRFSSKNKQQSNLDIHLLFPLKEAQIQATRLKLMSLWKRRSFGSVPKKEKGEISFVSFFGCSKNTLMQRAAFPWSCSWASDHPGNPKDSSKNFIINPWISTTRITSFLIYCATHKKKTLARLLKANWFMKFYNSIIYLKYLSNITIDPIKYGRKKR